MFKPLIMLDVLHTHAEHNATTYVVSIHDVCFLTLNRREENRNDDVDTNYLVVSKEFGTLQGTLRLDEVEALLPALESYEKNGTLASMGYVQGSGSGYWISPDRLTGIAANQQRGTNYPRVTLHFEGGRQHTLPQTDGHYAQTVKFDIMRMVKHAERLRDEAELRRAKALVA